MPTALLLIDIQQSLCTGTNAAWDCPTLIARINQVTTAARQAKTSIIWVRHAEPGLEAGTPGWQLADGLQVESTDLTLDKTTGDAFWKTDLLPMLQNLGVQELVIGGMHTEYCVDVTTRAALRHGYPVVLLEDAHTTCGNAAVTPQQVIAHHNITLSSTSSFGPRARLQTAQQWADSVSQA
ncbi:isochorismatase family protein [Comamonas sp. MYb396]|uniref:isochorismatase family protein n=1 Tax=Comamonas sp. MYb396 TaxID=2745302 RepID=UPI0030AB67AD